MKISDGEKLIILMLSDLYEKIGIDGDIDPDFIRSAIFNEQTWGIPWKYSGIPFDDQFTPPIVKEVLDILEMWSFIEYSYSELSEEDKQYVEKEAHPFGKDPKFRGFDGNTETEFLGAAAFIVNELDRFEEFKGREFNSHCPSVDAYRRMMSVFNGIRNRYYSTSLDAEQVALMLKEITHPDNRKISD